MFRDGPRKTLEGKLMSTPNGLKRRAGPLRAAGAILLIAGLGAVAFYMGRGPEAVSPEKTKVSRSEPVNESILRLNDYVRSVETKEPAVKPAADPMLPDVSTMIERLAARLETKPDDVKGWRMLGWSYFQLERYDEATKALARAITLDPNSADLKLAYEEAKAKASGSNSRLGIAPSGDGLHEDKK
jgi:cytochrome c-type biogenesis protein CcmH/NrfG